MTPEASRIPTPRALEALPYHHEVVQWLREEEPDVWRWAASLEVREQHAADVRDQLLRDTYRLEPAAHPEAYAALDVARERLGIAVPATLYQAGGSGANAMLWYLADHAHVVLQGPLLERLAPEELLALLGHELAHHRLWTAAGGEFLVADRILQHTLADPAVHASHLETARLFGLHTEAYADRGAAIAAGSPAPAITTLVKVHTGIAAVDAAAYLRQAQELESRDPLLAHPETHPETFVRALALDRWWRGEADGEAWLRRRLQGPVALERLDVTAQRRLQRVARGCIAAFLADPGLRSERVLLQAREYFPDVSPGGGDDAAFAGDLASDGERGFAVAMLLDLALADEDLREAALRRAVALADGFDGRAGLLTALARDAGLGKREIDRLAKLPVGEVTA